MDLSLKAAVRVTRLLLGEESTTETQIPFEASPGSPWDSLGVEASADAFE